MHMKISGLYYEYSVTSCCERFYSWASNDCIAGSGGTISELGSNKWYVDHMEKVCKKDCPEGSDTCGGLAESWETLHETAATCCRDNLSWITPSTCEAQSTHTAAGTSKWYVNYGVSKCVQDCEGTGTCGGIVSNNLDLYDSVGACCDSKLWWVPTSFCVADSIV